MQKANYNETNGIVVGPEISRLFAEVLLQEIDSIVLKNLYNSGYVRNVDFEIKRYLDDIYIFSNSEDTLNKIFKNYKDKLEEYKLFINEIKTGYKSVPLISDKSVAKNDLRKELVKLRESLLSIDENAENRPFRIKESFTPFKLSRSFINEFKCIAKKNGVGYENLSGEVFNYLKREFLLKFHKIPNEEKETKKFENLLSVICDIAFYSFSMDLRFNSSFKISEIVISLINETSHTSDYHFKHNIYSKIFEQINKIIEIGFRKQNSDLKVTNIEILNLLVLSKRLGYQEYLFNKEKLCKIFFVEDESIEDLNYFQIVCLLYYIGDVGYFNDFLNQIEESLRKKFQKTSNLFLNAEHTCLFFDLITCPYLSEGFKLKLISQSKFGEKNPKVFKDEIENQGIWFMNWRIEDNLENLLKEKEWGDSY